MKYIKSIVLIALLCFQQFSAQEQINLAGEWHLKLDPDNIGISQQWYKHTVFKSTLQLPGCIQEQGYGNKPTVETKWWMGQTLHQWFQDSPWLKEYTTDGNFKTQAWLVPDRHYIGAVWYSKKIKIPENWNQKHLTLFLERCHWETRLWIDGQYFGDNRSLATPHIYDVSNLKPGQHQIVLRVDNSEIVSIGRQAHSVSEQTAGTWNGITGKIQLEMEARVWIEDYQIYPDIEKKSVKVRGTIKRLQNKSGGDWQLTINVKGYNNGNDHAPEPARVLGIMEQFSTTPFEFEFAMGDNVKLWDEFDPNLYKMSLRLDSEIDGKHYSNTKSKSFGMRQFKATGRQFSMNNITTFLRGNTDCAVTPKTGYAPMDVASWKKIWKAYKDFGLNMARFHSWCPPEAAFIAADEMGIYLAPEVGEWVRVKNKDQFDFLREESIKILGSYGNSPSFIQMGLGNESSGDKEYFTNLINQWKNIDTRHFYTVKANSSGNPPNIDFEIVRKTAKESSSRIRYQSGWPPTPEGTKFHTEAPNTTTHWSEAVLKRNYPLIQHETAQICAYPNIETEMQKYTGYLKPTYLQIAKEQLLERGMYDQLSEFVQASGKWQVELTREEFEAAHRTKELGGFNWLSLADFTGQNTAPVGFTDAFYDTKPYVTPSTVRNWNAPTVLVARMEKRVFTNSDQLKAEIQLTHYGKEKLQLKDLKATLKNEAGEVLEEWQFEPQMFGQGSAQKIDAISFDLKVVDSPSKLRLELNSKQNKLTNSWGIWVFPTENASEAPKSIFVTTEWNKAIERKLKRGKKVLLLPKKGKLKGELPICFTNYYWTSFDENKGQSSAAGILIQDNHPLFDQFPTENHANWQWWDLLTHCQPMIFDAHDTKDPWPKTCKPIVQPIDSWKINRKLALVAEARVGKGKLLICAIDIQNNLTNRPATRQFRKSLWSYMQSNSFNPTTEVTTDMIKELFNIKATDNKEIDDGNLPTEG